MKNVKSILIIVLIILFVMGIMNFINPTPRGEFVMKEDDGKPTITILAGQSTSDAGTEEMIQKVLEEKFPDVNFQWICVGWASDNYKMRLMGKYDISNPPDIIIGKAQDAASYAETQLLLPVPEECVRNVPAEDVETVTHDGQIYALPYTCQYQGVLYNKELFAENNFAVPQSTEDLQDLVKQMEEKGITPFASHYQEAWNVGNNSMQFFMNEIFQYDPDWGDELRSGNSSFRDNPQAKQCMYNSRYILEHSWEDALQLEQYDCDERFAKGEAAMYLTGCWSLQTIGQTSQLIEIGIFPYPNEAGDAKLIKEYNISFMKGRNTKNSELVDEILLELGNNLELAKNVADYTKGESTFTSLQDYVITEIQSDIAVYEKNNRVIDVNIGNKQLIWSYQSDVAEEELLWLQGKKGLDEVLTYADMTIENSLAVK